MRPPYPRVLYTRRSAPKHLGMDEPPSSTDLSPPSIQSGDNSQLLLSLLSLLAPYKDLLEASESKFTLSYTAISGHEKMPWRWIHLWRNRWGSGFRKGYNNFPPARR